MGGRIGARAKEKNEMDECRSSRALFFSMRGRKMRKMPRRGQQQAGSFPAAEESCGGMLEVIEV